MLSGSFTLAPLAIRDTAWGRSPIFATCVSFLPLSSFLDSDDDDDDDDMNDGDGIDDVEDDSCLPSLDPERPSGVVDEPGRIAP